MADLGGDNLAEAVKRAKELAAKMIPAAGLGNSEDTNSRKRPLDESDEGPQVKKPSIDAPLLPQPIATSASNPQAIAQAAIAKVGAQLGLTQMITIEIKIPNRLVGLVIGRQGEMINRLQSDSQARIQVAPDGSEIAGERKVTICGTPDTVERAKAMVNKIVDDAGGATTMPVNLEPGQEVVELQIPANKVGLVIGKGGEMIKALQEQAGCKMQMIQDGPYATTPEKPLRMTGLPEQCRKGRELVLRLIEQKELEARGLIGDFGKAPGMPQTIEVRNTEVQVPKGLVGFVIGRNGEHINNIQNTCGVRLQFQNDIPGIDYRLATISGPPDACQRAKTMVEDIVAERQTTGVFKPRLELPNPTGPGVATVQCPVPAQKCGLIIGKSGDTIRQLQVQSGAHIELHRGDHPNPHEKLFNIRGTPQQIEHAQTLIRQKCEMAPVGAGQFPNQAVPGLPYQGGGPMYGGPQQAAYAGAQGGATPWTQYPYQQAYGAAQAQQQAQSDPAHQAAWAAYYQQLYAAQAQAAQQQGATAQVNQQQQQHSQQQPGNAQTANLQAQWAEYYRSLEMTYYNQQGGQQQNPAGGESGPPQGGGGEPGKDCPDLPSPALELQKFLLSPQNLPIYEVRRAQRFWPRQADPRALYHVDVCPLHTDIAVERDLTTGELLDYHEVELSDVGLTSKNSTSLNRTPGPPSLSVKGDPTNYPFWPGGMKESEVVQRIKEEASGLDFERNLLTTPPGFKEGMVLDNSSPVNSNDTNKPLTSFEGAQIVSISELLFGSEGRDGAAIIDWGEDEREVVDKQDKVSVSDVISHTEQVSTETESTETLDGVLTDVHSQPAQETGERAPTTKEEWVVKIDLNATVDDFHQRIPNMAHEWPFELDPFQKQAILRLEEHESVFVAAHTSAGKTVVAEYAIALSISHKTRVIYTSPIKALSNQKFRDFRKTFGEEFIGLLTGDVQIRQEAPCLIMTTEILRSMLYNGSDVIRDVEWVVFDEVHYINDSERGVVWEEVLIMLPEHVHVIMLSATVPNAMEFADWVGRTKQKKIYVISTPKRPVPLKHYLYTGNSKQTSDQLFEIVGEDKQFKTKGYQAALDAKKEKNPKGASNFGPKSRQHPNPKQDRNVLLSLVNMLQKKEKLPVVAFTFSRNRCNDNADSLTTLDLTTAKEKSEIHVFFQKSISLLKGSDQKLPQVTWMRELLKRGIAVHHSGILPIIKEVIELLFQRGLVKLLFATETFAMGVNMPARTVVFDSTRKHDGIRMRDLFPGEYVQMAGRAGRRGLDPSGTVILLCKADVPESSDLHKMILGRPTTLQSQFRLTYSMLLNLMRVETLRVEDMMKRSFAEMDSARHEVDRRQTLDSLENNIISLQGREDCPLCMQDIDHYYSACARITELQKEMQEIILSNPQVLKALSPGRVVVLDSPVYQYCLAVVLQQSTKKAIRTFTILMLCNAGQDTEDIAPTLVDVEQYKVVKPYQAMTELFHPDGTVHHTVIEVDGHLIVGITQETLKVEPSRIIEDYRKRQIPRFRGDPPWPVTANTVQGLLRIVEAHSSGIPLLDPVTDFKLTNMDFVEKKMEKQQFEQTMIHYSCLNCPQFKEHFDVACQKARLQEQLSSLKFMLSEASLQLLPEYNQRVKVLKHLNYLSDNGSVELKGRVACELHSHEVLLTELLFQNVFADFTPAEIVALLSCMVFQQSKCSEPNLTQRLQKGKEGILSVARSIAETERQFGLDVSVDDYLRELKFGLLEVVFEWGNGMEFVEITKLTDVLEGMIVRCIQRLDETCKDVRNAARVIGDPKLQHKMQEASRLIKRDIVFAASLYTI